MFELLFLIIILLAIFYFAMWLNDNYNKSEEETIKEVRNILQAEFE